MSQRDCCDVKCFGGIQYDDCMLEPISSATKGDYCSFTYNACIKWSHRTSYDPAIFDFKASIFENDKSKSKWQWISLSKTKLSSSNIAGNQVFERNFMFNLLIPNSFFLDCSDIYHTRHTMDLKMKITSPKYYKSRSNENTFELSLHYKSVINKTIITLSKTAIYESVRSVLNEANLCHLLFEYMGLPKGINNHKNNIQSHSRYSKPKPEFPTHSRYSNKMRCIVIEKVTMHSFIGECNQEKLINAARVFEQMTGQRVQYGTVYRYNEISEEMEHVRVSCYVTLRSNIAAQMLDRGLKVIEYEPQKRNFNNSGGFSFQIENIIDLGKGVRLNDDQVFGVRFDVVLKRRGGNKRRRNRKHLVTRYDALNWYAWKYDAIW